MEFQFRAKHVVPRRMEEIEKSIEERNFKNFAELTMKVNV